MTLYQLEIIQLVAIISLVVILVYAIPVVFPQKFYQLLRKFGMSIGIEPYIVCRYCNNEVEIDNIDSHLKYHKIMKHKKVF